MSTFTEYLRAVAEWYDAHPEVPQPYTAPFNVFLKTADEFAAVARQLGHAEKDVTHNWAYLRVPIAGGSVEFNVPRAEVCERRVVGVRDVPEQVIAAHQEEIVEWDCRPVLAEQAATS